MFCLKRRARVEFKLIGEPSSSGLTNFKSLSMVILVCGPMKEDYAFIIMIKDKWWREFCRFAIEGRKVHSYVQGGWAPPKSASLMFFYVAKPVRQIAGYADFIERKVGEARALWKEHGSESVLSSEGKYLEFVKDKERVSFIRFKNLREAAEPIPLSNVLTLLGMKRLSRKGFYVEKETADKLLTLMKC
jgi:predicted transcriptional regulator